MGASQRKKAENLHLSGETRLGQSLVLNVDQVVMLGRGRS